MIFGQVIKYTWERFFFKTLAENKAGWVVVKLTTSYGIHGLPLSPQITSVPL